MLLRVIDCRLPGNKLSLEQGAFLLHNFTDPLNRLTARAAVCPGTEVNGSRCPRKESFSLPCLPQLEQYIARSLLIRPTRSTRANWTIKAAFQD